MTKKKTKKNNLLFCALAIILGIAAIVFASLPIFDFHELIESSNSSTESYKNVDFGVFGTADQDCIDYMEFLGTEYDSFGKVLALIAVIVLIVGVVGILIPFVIGMLKKANKTLNLVAVASSVLVILASIVFCVGTIVYTSANVAVVTIIITTTYEIAVENFIFAIIPVVCGVVSGALGILAYKK